VEPEGACAPRFAPELGVEACTMHLQCAKPNGSRQKCTPLFPRNTYVLSRPLVSLKSCPRQRPPRHESARRRQGMPAGIRWEAWAFAGWIELLALLFNAGLRQVYMPFFLKNKDTVCFFLFLRL